MQLDEEATGNTKNDCVFKNSTDLPARRMISSTDQLVIARALLTEGRTEARKSDKSINARGIARKYKLDPTGTRRFMSKLARYKYMENRIVEGRIRSTLDYDFIRDGYNRLLREYINIVSAES